MDTNLPLDINLPSEQEMLDTVYDHFITKGNPPSFVLTDNGRTICRYRGPNGTKCAFGIFIPNELYTFEMEGHGPESIVKMHEISFKHFCNSLQRCHDDAAIRRDSGFKTVMINNLLELARIRNLTLPA